VDELIDCGVDILNPIQPKTRDMEPAKLKNAYGDNIVFHGGFDTQGLLPFGSKEEIEQAVKEIMADFNVNGGYIFACAHNIQEDVPPKNIEALFQAARKYGRKMR
jgi:uroporphyrinogen decarboxylase